LPNRWYFEVCDIYRRMIFISFLPLLGTQGAVRTTVGCLIAIISIAFVREAAPFIRSATNLLMNIASYQIFLDFFGAFIIITGALDDLSLSDTTLGTLLFSVNFIILVLCAVWGLARLKRERIQRSWRNALNNEELNILNRVMLESFKMSGPIDMNQEAEVGTIGDDEEGGGEGGGGGDIEMKGKGASKKRKTTKDLLDRHL
jgi:hypothetical protein